MTAEEIKRAYIDGFIEGGVAEKMSGFKFDIEGMAESYAQQKLKEVELKCEYCDETSNVDLICHDCKVRWND